MDYRIGLLSALFIILSPRFFAESFYNDKDIVFATSIAIAMFTLILFLEKQTVTSAIVHGFATAFAVDIRIMGIIVFIGTIAVFTVKLLKIRKFEPQKTSFIYQLSSLFAYLVSTLLFIILMFPWLWENPYGHFKQAFINMAHFRWNGNVLYFGQSIAATDLPWHYIVSWIGITTPVFFIFLFTVGSMIIVKQIISQKLALWSNDQQMIDFIFISSFFLPVATVILLHSVLYDGWRQLYFVYPAFVLISTRGFVFIFKKLNNKIRIVFLGLTLLALLYNAVWIFKAHPLQNVYFNSFAKRDLRYHFDVDYWGLWQFHALKHILSQDDRPAVSVFTLGSPALDKTKLLLEEDEKKKLVPTSEMNSADYLLTNYRSQTRDQIEELKNNFKPFYHKKIDDEIVFSIYKKK